MDVKERNQLSKFMSLILRHDPEKFGVSLDPEGYCSLEFLHQTIAKERNWKHINEAHVLEVVKHCPKQRYEVTDGYIRARYGHSKVGIQYDEKTPPDVLIHGTHTGVVKVILETGIKKMNRRYVHLSETTHFATLSGQRRGKVAFIYVDTKKARTQGVKFYYAGDEVWLTEFVPADCLSTKV